MLVIGSMINTFFKNKEKQGSLLDPNPGPHACTLVLGPSQEYFWHRRLVLRFRNLVFDQDISQQQFSLFFDLKLQVHVWLLFLYILSYNYIFDIFYCTLKLQLILWPRWSSCSISTSAIHHVFLGFSVSMAVFSQLGHSSWPTRNFSCLCCSLQPRCSPILGPSLSWGRLVCARNLLRNSPAQ